MSNSSPLSDLFGGTYNGDNGGQYNCDPDFNTSIGSMVDIGIPLSGSNDISPPRSTGSNRFTYESDIYAERGLRLINTPQGASRSRSMSAPANPANAFPDQTGITKIWPIDRRSSVIRDYAGVSTHEPQIPATIHEVTSKGEDNEGDDVDETTKRFANTSLNSTSLTSSFDEEKSPRSKWSHSPEMLMSHSPFRVPDDLAILAQQTPTRTHVPLNFMFGGNDFRWQADRINSFFQPHSTPVDKQVKAHRESAARSEPRYTWSGQLPVTTHMNPVYSPKVFLGGMPYEVSDHIIIESFKKYGAITIQWPARDRGGPSPSKAGYVYVIFEHDRNVKSLLKDCQTDQQGKYYFQFNTLPSHNKAGRRKDVQVIPWIIADSNYIRTPSQRLDNTKTVFVGALHGMLTAEGLAHVMNDLFSNVSYVGIDTDKYKYPMGSARVTFSNQKSYLKAVQACFIDIRCQRFTKKIQVDPYIDSGHCSQCKVSHGPIFCREESCFRYFCYKCYNWNHSTPETANHRPLMRARRPDITTH